MSRIPKSARLYWIYSALTCAVWIALVIVQSRISWSLPILAAFFAFQGYRASASNDS